MNMKSVGVVLIGIGIAMLLFVIYTFVSEQNRIVSPIPDEQGVKVIFVSPGK